VALKQLLDAGPGWLRRFEREAAVTSRLQHPSIVPVYEAGRLPTGEPFYAMKLVSGRTLRDLIDERTAPQERLALLPHALAMADAVAYAHGHGIIHRDLKPGNVIVGAFGETIVIDWGLAKDLRAGPVDEPAGQVEGDPERTAWGTVIGTPAYMAPEQARGHPVDERADVWALGATLYHLLSGRPPYAGTSEAVLASVKTRQPEPLARIEPSVPHELAALVDKAMARDPALRYPSARELAEDLRRFQAGQLVGAYRYSFGALAARWMRRHRSILGVVAAALVVLAVAAGVAVRRIVAERDRANREALSSHRVSDFMVGMFQVSDPSEARGDQVTAREILDKAAQDIEAAVRDPDVQARLTHTLGRVYESLGLYARARPLAEKAVALRRNLLGEDDPETLASLAALAKVDVGQARFADAERIQRRVVEGRRRALGPEHPDTVMATVDLGASIWGAARYVEAEALDRQALELSRRVLGREHPTTLLAMQQLAMAQDFQGQFAVAEASFRELYAIQRRMLGPDHLDTLRTVNNIGNTVRHLGRFGEAERLYLEALDGCRRSVGPEHPRTLAVMANLGGVEIELGRYADAERRYREILAIQRRVLGPSNPDVAESIYDLGCVVAIRGHLREGLDFVHEAVEMGLPPQVAGFMWGDTDCFALTVTPEFQALAARAARR
jgi:tetratricopeptide (TPR) repeat protein